MYNLDDIGSTYLSLPPNLQDVENECFAYALDKQIKKFHELAKSLTIWSNLDEVDPKYYDYLALCIRAPYYRSEYENEMKLSLLKTSLEMNRYAGTRSAIDKLLDTIFERAEFKPWYDYDGEPYHFKPIIYDTLAEDANTVFMNVIKKVKAARSVMDEVEVARQLNGRVTYGAGMVKGKHIYLQTIDNSSYEIETELKYASSAVRSKHIQITTA
ncbi:MAG: hypothetical protein E7273_13395 [Pseudobutyrivibrio ruminis]|nr:hypothetical protein [Pseudobutyrivibrio ruminis]